MENALVPSELPYILLPVC